MLAAILSVSVNDIMFSAHLTKIICPSFYDQNYFKKPNLLP